MAEQSPIKKYRANCHCAAYVYEVNLPEIKIGLQSDDSYCYKRAGVFQCPQSDNDITFVKGDPATLTSYSFGDVKHQFCANCGTYLFRVDSKAYVNLRAFQNLNVWDLDTKRIDSASPPPDWTPPKFEGPEPPAGIAGASKIYTGGCHCGGVTIALKIKPIDSTYDDPIVECDCSICSRNGYCWIYPTKPQVTIMGWYNVSYYAFGRHIWRKTFCRACGVPLGNYIETYDAEEIEKLPEENREWVKSHLDWSPVNVRVLDGVDMGELNVTRVNGSALRAPFYVNP
ncbi:coatomer subunit beta [Hypoxylon texense]